MIVTGSNPVSSPSNYPQDSWRDFLFYHIVRDIPNAHMLEKNVFTSWLETVDLESVESIKSSCKNLEAICRELNSHICCKMLLQVAKYLLFLNPKGREGSVFMVEFALWCFHDRMDKQLQENLVVSLMDRSSSFLEVCIEAYTHLQKWDEARRLLAACSNPSEHKHTELSDKIKKEQRDYEIAHPSPEQKAIQDFFLEQAILKASTSSSCDYDDPEFDAMLHELDS